MDITKLFQDCIKLNTGYSAPLPSKFPESWLNINMSKTSYYQNPINDVTMWDFHTIKKYHENNLLSEQTCSEMLNRLDKYYKEVSLYNKGCDLEGLKKQITKTHELSCDELLKGSAPYVFNLEDIPCYDIYDSWNFLDPHWKNFFGNKNLKEAIKIYPLLIEYFILTKNSFCIKGFNNNYLKLLSPYHIPFEITFIINDYKIGLFSKTKSTDSTAYEYECRRLLSVAKKHDANMNKISPDGMTDWLSGAQKSDYYRSLSTSLCFKSLLKEYNQIHGKLS